MASGMPRVSDWFGPEGKPSDALVRYLEGFPNDIDRLSDALRVDIWSFHVEFPENGDYKIIAGPGYTGSIKKTRTRCDAGTATLAIKINNVSIGDANSVGTSTDEKTHDAAFDGNDTIELAFSSVSGCEKVAVTIEIEKDLS